MEKKVIVNSQIFNSAAQKVVAAIPSNAIIPILECIKISVNGDYMELAGTDLDLYTSITIECNSDSESFSFCVNGKKLLGIFKSLATQKIVFDVDEKMLTVKTETGKYKLPIENSLDYPEPESVEDVDNIPFVRLSHNDMSTMAKGVSGIISEESIQTAFNGAFLEIGDNVKLTATDRFCLSSYRFNQLESKNKGTALVSKQFINYIKMLPSTNGECSLLIGERAIFFVDENVSCSSKLIDINFPDYEMIIPKKSSITTVVNVGELTAALDRVKSMSDEAGTIKFKFGRDTGLHIYSINSTYGNEAEEKVEVSEYKGDDLEICFTYRSLVSILGTLKGKDITLELTHGKAAMAVKVLDEQYLVSLVMPTLNYGS